MPITDPRVDAYIAKAAPFAQPILIRLRRAVHRGCPDVVETLKWSVPAFEYNGILCGMAAFKAHCLFNLWKAPLVKDQGLPKAAKAPARVPADLKAALAKRPAAATAFEAMSPSHKREYVEWVTGAKGADTRARRVAQTVLWVGEGKNRNWKYEKRCAGPQVRRSVAPTDPITASRVF